MPTSSPGEPSQYSRRWRVERLIAVGRLLLAVFSLVAIWLDPPEPAAHAQTLYLLVSGYVIYALLVGWLVWRLATPHGRLRLVTHAFDLAAFSLFNFTEGPTSPFFVYFVFALVSATLRWGWRGTLWTGGVALAIFVGIGVYVAGVLRTPEFDLERFVIRSAYLTVVAGLLAYLGAYEQRLRREMSSLAGWPRSIPREARTLAQEALEQAAGILGVPRTLMAWSETEEPWLHLAAWSRGIFRWTHEPPDTFQPLVAAPLVGTHFLCPDARAREAVVVYGSAAGFQRWHGSPLHPNFQARFDVGAVLALSLHGATHEGWLFALDRPRMTSDDLILGEIVATQVAARIQHFYLLQQLQRAAATEERIRVARDLHDGLLQSLTGVALQLQTVRRRLPEMAESVQERLLEIERLITEEQRDLRVLIRELKVIPPEQDVSLVTRLEKLANKVERYWGLTVKLEAVGLETPLPEALEQEIYHLVYEALVNAARHGGASETRVHLATRDDQIRLAVRDNGHGFPFRGHYDHAALTRLKLGPVTLRERAAALGGSLSIDSSDAGAWLEIRVPMRRAGVEHAH